MWSHGRKPEKVVTEDKVVKSIWKKYTEVLYRRDPNVNDNFVETEYEDEPEVLESEVKDALRHISNRKPAGGGDIPIELLKAAGDEAVKVLTTMCNCVWKKKEWPSDWKNQCMSRFTRKETGRKVEINSHSQGGHLSNNYQS